MPSGSPAEYLRQVARSTRLLPARAVDLAVDLGFMVLIAVAMLIEARIDDTTDVDGVTVALVVTAVAPLLVRRRHPIAALVGCFLALFALEVVIEIYQTIPLPAMLAGYTVARKGDRRRAILLGVVLVPVVLVNLAIASEHAFVSAETVKTLAFVALPLALAVAARNRQDFLDALVERAETAERTREEEARRRVDEERLRIARDLHDLVAHALVAINVQAGVAAHVADPDPETNRRTFRDIKDVSGEALADLRGTLGILRAAGEEAPVAPTAGLGDLPDLRARLEAVGVEVELVVDRGPDPLPVAVESAGFRIVQEALTNVMRHAAPTAARVVVRREADEVVVEVVDAGPREQRSREGGSGNGIRGMHERARAVGGTVEAGPAPGGGWRVRARLPLVAAVVGQGVGQGAAR
jgi:signal transduction histidine kinase